MKKLLFSIVCFLAALCGMAQQEKVYIEPLVIIVNAESTPPQDVPVIVVDNGDGTVTFRLENFFLAAGEESMPVGTIELPGLKPEVGEDGLLHLYYDGLLTIQEGDLQGVDMWAGPMIGEIPLKLQCKFNEEKLFVTIDIDMQETLGQIVVVQLGTDDFAPARIVGDLNGDEKVDIADAVTVLNVMAEGSDSPDADLNGDEKVDIADFVTVLNIMAGE